MSGLKVLLVAGTHGNEINAPWLFDQWEQRPELLNTNGVEFCRLIGNPEALKICQRYLDRDLNRSFSPNLLEDSNSKDYEVQRARDLLSCYGPYGSDPCQLVIDLHSTTSEMGSSLVIYGRRSADLAFASLIQSHIGLPVYLHEGDSSQQGFLVESWPCGIVIEIGPVPQSLLLLKIIEQTKLILEVCFEQISKINSGLAAFPKQLIVHRHLGSLDFPRGVNNKIASCLHSSMQGKDWLPLHKGSPIFVDSIGDVVCFDGESGTIPVFINEAAYIEKNIAMSITKREVLPFNKKWEEDLLCSF